MPGEEDMKIRSLIITGAICLGGMFGPALHKASADSATVSFQIHNNQGDIKTLEIYDAGDMNNPSLVKTILDFKSGSTTPTITISTIPGATVGRANWSWDGKETNKINVEDNGAYELSSGVQIQ
jgi:flagellar hook assembly protein FlgD